MTKKMGQCDSLGLAEELRAANRLFSPKTLCVTNISAKRNFKEIFLKVTDLTTTQFSEQLCERLVSSFYCTELSLGSYAASSRKRVLFRRAIQSICLTCNERTRSLRRI